MQEIDIIIDDQTEKALELVTLAIRNRHAHQELQSFNDTGEFKYVHRLMIDTRYKKSLRDKLKKLKKENPEAFLIEITNNIQNIRRIESDINKKKYKDEAQHQSWIENLDKAKIKREIILKLI